jgi:hypothetical protein
MATAMSAVAAAKMNLRPVNRSALRRYQQFWNSLVVLDAAMGGVAQLMARADGASTVRYSYRVPAVEEVLLAAVKVSRSIEAMIGESKKWEAELVSREWQ